MNVSQVTHWIRCQSDQLDQQGWQILPLDDWLGTLDRPSDRPGSERQPPNDSQSNATGSGHPDPTKYPGRWVAVPNFETPASRSGPRWLLAASRFPKHPSITRYLSDTVRTLVMRRDAQSISNARDPCLITATGMTLDPLLNTLAPRLGIPCLRLCISRQNGLSDWLRQTAATRVWPDQNPTPIRVSPDSPSKELGADQLAFRLANQLFLLYVRQAGMWWRLAERAVDTCCCRVWVTIPDPHYRDRSQQLVKHDLLAKRLMKHGAIGWYLRPETARQDSPATLGSAQVQCWTAPGKNEFLFHHTRGCRDAWPEETTEEYWMRWLWEAGSTDPSRTLLRILVQRRLRGSGRLIPGGNPMVCFTAVTPCPSQRRFRSHLQRWDYEPYGLAISRAALIQAGARPVSYWDPASQSLPANVPAELTQKRFSRSRNGRRVDWSLECEFRYPGDLSLSQFDSGQLFVFVASKEEAEQLARYCSWPIRYFRQQVGASGNIS